MKNKAFLRVLAGLLAVISLLLAAVGCEKKEEEAEQTGPADNGEIVMLDEPVVVADGAGVYF